MTDETQKEPGPFHEVAEQITTLVSLAKAPEAVAFAYEQMIEALIHPHNADALDTVRGIVAIAKYSEAKGGNLHSTGLRAVLTCAERVLDHLGVEPLDFERDVKPGVDETTAEAISVIEARIAKQVAQHLAEQPVEGPVH